MRTARLTVLIATLFAALAVPTLAQASDPHQWSVNARAGRITAATSYELINNDRARVSDYPDADLTVSHHHLTVDLGWGRDGNWQFVGRNPRDHRTLPAGATVALYNAKYHKYLYHAIQGFGVDLDTSDSPVYEWKVDGSSGALSLYDTDAKSFLIRKHETWGIDLGWQRDGPPPTQVGTVHSASVFMTEQPIVEGFVPYLGSYGGGGFPPVPGGGTPSGAPVAARCTTCTSRRVVPRTPGRSPCRAPGSPAPAGLPALMGGGRAVVVLPGKAPADALVAAGAPAAEISTQPSPRRPGCELAPGRQLAEAAGEAAARATSETPPLRSTAATLAPAQRRPQSMSAIKIFKDSEYQFGLDIALGSAYRRGADVG